MVFCLPGEQGAYTRSTAVAGSRKEKTGDRRVRVPTRWDAFAEWYDGWVGEHGSEFHREVAIPAVLDLLAPKPNEQILDIGSGQGVLAPYVRKAGARYTGVDASPRLVEKARTRHGKMGRFVVGDARDLASVRQIAPGSFDAAVFMLSIQDMA